MMRDGMLLVVDVGNTQTHFGTFRGDELIEHWRFATVRTSTSDELGAALRNLLELRGVGLADLSASIVSSTVPQLEPEWLAMANHYLGHRMLAVGPGIRTGMPIKIDNPRELGADRLVNAVAAYERLGGPCVSVDFGTAVNFDVVSAQGEYMGGVLMPGVEISLDALTSRRDGRSARARSTRSAPASSSGSRAPSTACSSASRRSWGRRRRRSPPAAWRASSRPTRRASTSSTTS
jgi:type III pantothenate kinase